MTKSIQSTHTYDPDPIDEDDGTPNPLDMDAPGPPFEE